MATKPINTDAIEQFMARAKGAAHSRSRDLRMETSEAMALAANIGEVLARMAALETRLAARMEAAATSMTVTLDGGTFKS